MQTKCAKTTTTQHPLFGPQEKKSTLVEFSYKQLFLEV